MGLKEGPGGPTAWGLQPVCQAVGLDFFGSMVAVCRAGTLNQSDARRFVTSFLEAKAKSVSSRPKRGTGECGYCGLGTLYLPCSGFLTPGWGHPRHSPTCHCISRVWPWALCPTWASQRQWGWASGPGLGWASRSRSGLTQSALDHVLG